MTTARVLELALFALLLVWAVVGPAVFHRRGVHVGYLQAVHDLNRYVHPPGGPVTL